MSITWKIEDSHILKSLEILSTTLLLAIRHNEYFVQEYFDSFTLLSTRIDQYSKMKVLQTLLMKISNYRELFQDFVLSDKKECLSCNIFWCQSYREGEDILEFDSNLTMWDYSVKNYFNQMLIKELRFVPQLIINSIFWICWGSSADLHSLESSTNDYFSECWCFLCLYPYEIE